MDVAAESKGLSPLEIWREYLTQSPVPMWVTAANRLVLANDPGLALFGVKDFAQLRTVEAKVLAVSAPGAPAPVRQTIERLDGRTCRAQIVSWPAEGTLQIFQAAVEPIPSDFDGSGIMDAGFANAEQLCRGLFSSSADCVKILDAAGRILYLNRGGRDLLAIPDPIEVLGMEWIELWRGEHWEDAREALEAARQGQAGRFAGRCPKWDGELRWWDVVLTPMPGDDRGPGGFLSISRDVTDLKQVQMLEAMERKVMESAASAQPLAETLDLICRLAEFTTNGGGKCAILALESDGRHYCVLSAPSLPELARTRVARTVSETGNPGAALFPGPESDWAMTTIPLTGPEGQDLGLLVYWSRGEAPETADLQETLATCTNMAGIALNQDVYLRRIRNKQQRLAAINRAAPVGLYQCEEDGYCIYSNERYSELTGLTAEQCSGEGWLESVFDEDRDIVIDVWRDARATRTPFKAEYRVVSKPGAAPRWVMAHESPMDGGGWVGTVIDISELKSALAAVAEGEERFRTLANNISQFCWMADGEGWIFWYNDRWYEYTGTTLEQMQGWGWREVHHPEHVDRVVDKVAEHFRTGEVWEDTFPLRSKDGTYRWFLSRALPIRDAEGKILRWFGTNTDITEQRIIEAEINRQNLALQRSNKELSQFAFFASHDLQEPLRMISSYAQLLQRSSAELLDPDSRRYIHAIIDSAGRMSRLIRDLLSYAEASGELKGTPETVNLNEIVAAVYMNLTEPIGETGAHFETSELPHVLGDSTQLAQVFQNLVSNSLKYRRPGIPPEIAISAERNGDYWKLLIRDNGQGFSQESACRIFDFLTRLHGREVPGSGIGLAICKSIIERSGGTIGAESEPGRGSTFWFTLPAA